MSTELTESVALGSTNLCAIRLGDVFFQGVESETVVRPEPDFDEVKDLCSDKPLQFQSYRNLDELETILDQADLADALESLKEPGSISLDDFKKQLGI
jgi:hypothetical protein